MRRVLVTAIGYGGSNSLVRGLGERSSLDVGGYEFLGANASAESLAKSPLEKNFLLPRASDSQYIEALRKIVKEQGVELIIANSDAEVAVISAHRGELGCMAFLPAHETVLDCQDKYRMYEKLGPVGIPMARSIEINSLDEIEAAAEQIGTDRFWIRPKVGRGSLGATWVRTAEQARHWIDLWVSLRGLRVDEFTVSEFLPGRDFCFQSVWKDGSMRVGKLCERLAYHGGEQRLSGMSSTPSVARTLYHEGAIATIMRAVQALDSRPNGNFNFDLKQNTQGEMCITECNIGRFCMITPIFDYTGKYNTAEVHIRSAFDEEMTIDEPLDIEQDCYLIRELDTLPTIRRASEMMARHN